MTGDATKGRSGLILYQTEDGRPRIQCHFEGETVWLTQAEMAEPFQTTPQNVTLHLKEILANSTRRQLVSRTCKLDRKEAGRSRGAYLLTNATPEGERPTKRSCSLLTTGIYEKTQGWGHRFPNE